VGGESSAGNRSCKGRRRIWQGTALLAIIAILVGIGDVLLHRYDPTRILYKRLRAADRYVYEEVDPAWRTPDPESQISPAIKRDPEQARRDLAALIWGDAGVPTALLPQTVEQNIAEVSLGDLGPGVSVDRLSLQMEHGISSHFHLLHAPRPKNRLVIYHHGYGDPISTAAPLFRVLLAHGYDVLAYNLLGRAGNSGLARLHANDRFYNVTSEMAEFERPLHFHVDPVVAGINYALKTGNYSSVDMVGLSMGGFMAILSAAADSRIARSYPVAADLPLHLRRGQEVLPGYPPYFPPLTTTFTRLELYMLGASGRDRRQIQIFNRYDRCCYFGLRGRVYEAAVARAAQSTPQGGHFAVLFDETHADHRLSRFTIDFLLSDLMVDR
jgi:hypothetical protein